jgi:predicted enzyme related to lactoylglutathione lyase
MEEYKKKWNGIFYDPVENYTGGWIEKEYMDSYETVKKFYKENLKIKIKQYFKITRYLNLLNRLFKGR